MTAPQLWVFAGPNGSGKSTLALRFGAGQCGQTTTFDFEPRKRTYEDSQPPLARVGQGGFPRNLISEILTAVTARKITNPPQRAEFEQ
jgi:ABC-type Mn2+/Zn2+ transport system ATPase subunit